MNTGKTIDSITETVLDKYRDSIPRKAFVEAMERVKNALAAATSLDAFIQEEVPFRLREIFGLPEGLITSDLIEDGVARLSEDTDAMFDYDSIDSILEEVLDEHGIEREDEFDD